MAHPKLKSQAALIASASALPEMGASEQAALLKSILESSTEYSIVAKDLQGLILAWNEGARRVYGYQASEVVGKAHSFILHDPEDVKSGYAQKILDDVRRNGKWEGELRRVRKDGGKFTAHVTFTLRRDPAGNPIGFTMISRDLTESQRVQRELRESQEYNRGLVESNVDALMTTDPLGIITDVNRQMCEVTEHDRDELIGTPFKRYFTDPQLAEDGIRKVLSEDRVNNYELVMRSKSGKETVVSYNATTFRSAEGKLKGVFAAARDITAQKKLEEELRQAQNYTRGLIEASVDALVTVDPQFRIMDVNEQMARVTGYTREELIESPFPDYFTDPDRAQAGVQKTLAESFVTNYVLVLRSKAGKETPVSFNASVFKDPGGKVRGVFAVARDITEQRRLEEQLREQQNYNRGLIESSIDALVTVDRNLAITDVNEQMATVTGYGREELIGSPFKDYFTEPARAAAGVHQTLDQGSVTNYDLVLRSKTGKRTVVSFNAGIFKDTAGRVAGVFAAARDITAQKRLEEQLRDQQNYNRGLIEASADALMTVDPKGVVTDINEQAVKLTGYNRKQLIGSPFVNYFTDPGLAQTGVEKTFQEGIVTNYELVVRTKTAKKIPVSFNATVFRDTGGGVAGILAAARDITQQKQIEQELREQQTYTRGLIESSVDALMTTDTLGLITDVNRQMCEVTGKAREELIGTPFKNYFTNPKLAEDGIRKVLAEGRVTNYELTLRSLGGEEIPVSYNATTFQGLDGRLRGVFASARDVTEQKTLEEKLRGKNEELEAQNRRVQEANRLKSEFLANMSHELRTPLNGIIGFSEIIFDGKAGPVSPTQGKYLGYILTSSRHLMQLINDVLDLAKVESGKIEFKAEPVVPERLIGEAREILRTLAAQKGIQIQVLVDPALQRVVLDPAKFKQVLYNYLSNALKFTSDGGRVRIRLVPEGEDYFSLEVEDTGIGIKPEDTGRLFVEFQQLDAGTAKKYQGTGLGLALTKRIVESQGGRVGVTSEPGKGSVFFAVFPRQAHPTPAAAAGKTEEALSPKPETPILATGDHSPGPSPEGKVAAVRLAKRNRVRPYAG